MHAPHRGYSGVVTAAAARVVAIAARSRDTQIIIAGFRVAAAISHGALTGIALRAERAAAAYAAAMADTFHTDAEAKFPQIRCIGCED